MLPGLGALGKALAWLRVAERAAALVHKLLPDSRPDDDAPAGGPRTHAEVEHKERQIRSASRAYPVPSGPPPEPLPPPPPLPRICHAPAIPRPKPTPRR